MRAEMSVSSTAIAAMEMPPERMSSAAEEPPGTPFMKTSEKDMSWSERSPYCVRIVRRGTDVPETAAPMMMPRSARMTAHGICGGNRCDEMEGGGPNAESV
jgi:hypothetical protein